MVRGGPVGVVAGLAHPTLAALLVLSCLAPGALAAGTAGEIEVPGGTLHYAETGNGPPLVLIHDGLLPSVSWEHQVEPLSRLFRVVTYDRRGYGLSPAPVAPFSAVDDLEAVLDALGIESAALIGCSAGGRLAVDFTLAHPERVEALVLVGPVVSGMGYTAHFIERAVVNLRPLYTEGDLERTAELWAADRYATDQRNAVARRRFRELVSANVGVLTVAVEPTPEQRPAVGHLGEIAVPTLLVVGESDIPDVLLHVGALAAGIPGAEIVVIPQAGHLAHFEQPELFNRLALEFLRPDAEAAEFLAGAGPSPPFEQLGSLFEYDRTAPLDVREQSTEDRGGVRVIDLSYASPVAGRVTGYLVLPVVEARVPAVLFQHGGQGDRSSFLAEARVLARHGVASLLIDSPGRRPEGWRPPADPAFGERMRSELTQLVIDQRRGLDLLASRPEVDPGRLAYVGHSLGATAGGVLVALEPRLAGSVMMAGFAAHTRSTTDGHKRWSVIFKNLYSAEDQSAWVEAMAPLDAIHYLPHRPPRPMLLQFARRDEYVSRWDAAVYRRAAGEPVAEQWFDTDHAFDLEARRDRLAWLLRVLGP